MGIGYLVGNRLSFRFSNFLYYYIVKTIRCPFFGDWLCQGSGEAIPNTYHYTGCNYAGNGFHDPEWHWGFRHYVWMVMGAVLTIIRAIGLAKKYDANI